MNIFLAGAENKPHFDLIKLVGVKNALISYYHIQDSEKTQSYIFDSAKENDIRIICDSGLFTMMFGAGKGKTYDFEFMKKYTADYIKMAKSWNLEKLTIVECDVHKILGMEQVYELRKQFEDSGLDVMYVWHYEEGLDGFHKLYEKYKYIAISVPELRILFKEKKARYQDGVKDLLHKIYKSEQSIPRIHLLGNTIMETMETKIAYSCDSTSWLSGARYGLTQYFIDNKIKTMRVNTDAFKAYRKLILNHYGDKIEIHKSLYGDKEHFENSFMSALAYKQCQDYLDKNYQWLHKEKSYENLPNHRSGNRSDSPKYMEP